MSKMITMTANRGGIKLMWDEEQVDQAQIKCVLCWGCVSQTMTNYNLSQKLTDFYFFYDKAGQWTCVDVSVLVAP